MENLSRVKIVIEIDESFEDSIELVRKANKPTPLKIKDIFNPENEIYITRIETKNVDKELNSLTIRQFYRFGKKVDLNCLMYKRK